MKRSHTGGIVAAALVALLAAFLLLQHDAGAPASGEPGFAPLVAPRSGPDEAPRFEAAPVDGGAAGSAHALLAAAADPAGSPANADAAIAAPAVLTGRVTLALDGSPAADVRILSVVDVDGVRAPPPLDEAASTARTDADGRYRLVYTRACTVTQLRVLPGARSIRLVREVALELRPGTETVQDLAVGSGGALSGRVVDTEGHPIPGAQVGSQPDTSVQLFEHLFESDRTTVADAAGEFVLEALGSPFTIYASAPGYALREQLTGTIGEGVRLGLAAGGRALEPPLTVVLSPERRIAGLVLGPDGAPLAGASIGTWPATDVAQKVTAAPDVYRAIATLPVVRSRADGRFSRDAVCSEPYDVSASATGTATWRGTHAPGDPELLIRLGAGLTLSGTVTAARDGAPVSSAQVLLDTSAGGFSTTRSGFSDEHGAFTLTGLEPDDHAELIVTCEGWAMLVRKPVVVAEGAAPLRVALDPEQVLAGRVVDVSGAGVRDARVRIEGDRVVDFGGMIIAPIPTWESQIGLESETTDAAGRFRFGQLYAGRFEITATAPRDESLKATITAASVPADATGDELLLVLDPHATSGVTITGVATDALTGRPVTSFDVTPMIPQGGGMIGNGQHFDAEDGAFRLTGLDPGPMMLTAQAPGCAPWSTALRDYEAGTHRLDIAFTASRQVRLRVLDEDREPLEAHLTFRDASGRGLMVEVGRGARNSQLRTDEHGEALASGLPAERLTVSVKRGWGRTAADFPLDLRAEPHGVVELVLGMQDSVQLGVLVFGAASAAAAPPAGTSLETWGATLPVQLKDGTLWLLESDARVRVTDAAGTVHAEAHLDAGAPAEDLKATQQMVPGAVRPALARLTVPTGTPLTITVEAPGYTTGTQAWQASPHPAPGEATEVLMLLRRP